MNKLTGKNFQIKKLGSQFKLNTNYILKRQLSFFNYSTENKMELKKNNLNEFRENFRKKNTQENNYEKKIKFDSNSKRSFEIKNDIPFPNDEYKTNISKTPLLKPTVNKYENKINKNYTNFDEEIELLPQQDLIPNIRAKGYFERDRLNTTTPKLDYMYGLRPVLSAMNGELRKIVAIYLDNQYQNSNNEDVKNMIKLAEAKNILVEFKDKNTLDMFTAGRQHDGFVLKTEDREFTHIKINKKFFDSMPKKTGNIIALLDKVIDPQNFGSIIRTCYYLGIDYLIVNKKHRPAISPALCQVSLGASENMPLYCLKLFNSFIQEAAERKWKIITTTLKNSINSKESILAYELPLHSYDNILIVFGSESSGLEGDIFSLANYNVVIPPQLDTTSINKGGYELVDSLNVGVSAGILLQIIKQKMI